MKKVLIATQKPFAPKVRDRMVEELKKADLEVALLEKYEGQDALRDAVQAAHAVIVRSDKITADIMAGAPNLELVIRGGAGYDNVDVECAKQRGIVVENTPGQNANAVAELALELILASLRPLNGKPGREVRGRVLGVHGFGNVGQKVARLGRVCGMKVRVCDMNLDRRAAHELGVTPVGSPHEVYEGADVVSLHIPENDATRGSIDRELLSLMSEDGVLVNTARAGVINEADLLDVLKERPAFRYATDVAPSGEVQSRVEAEWADRIVVTPKKQGAQTLEANTNTGMAAVRQAIAFFKEGDTTFCVYKLIPPHLEHYTRLAVQLGKLNACYVENPREIQMTGYGELNEFADTLAEYVLKGLFVSALGEGCTPDQAAEYARDHGVRTVIREPDDMRGYGNAITIDFVAEDGTAHSSRGRIDEKQLEASRIGEFKARMPLDPGLYVIAAYKEGPGMADRVGHVLTDHGYNRVRLGAGPNIDNTKAQAFFQIEKAGLSSAEQIAEARGLAQQMSKIPDVYDVKVISLM